MKMKQDDAEKTALMMLEGQKKQLERHTVGKQFIPVLEGMIKKDLRGFTMTVTPTGLTQELIKEASTKFKPILERFTKNLATKQQVEAEIKGWWAEKKKYLLARDMDVFVRMDVKGH
jgi:hypothetical protein